jgi:hypothetical protein
MTEPFNIHFLHGSYFTAEICFTDVVGRISVNSEGFMYLCQNEHHGSTGCEEFFGYKYAWFLMPADNPILSGVQNLKILPSPLEYHAFLGELIDYCNKCGDPEIPMSMVSEFLDRIKVFEPKNLDNN